MGNKKGTKAYPEDFSLDINEKTYSKQLNHAADNSILHYDKR